MHEYNTYEEWIDIGKHHDKLVSLTSVALKQFIPDDLNGAPLPDHIRLAPEYRELEKMFDKEFKSMQNFNKNSPKEYKKRRSVEFRENHEWKTIYNYYCSVCDSYTVLLLLFAVIPQFHRTCEDVQLSTGEEITRCVVALPNTKLKEYIWFDDTKGE